MLVLFVACFFTESVWDRMRYLKYVLPLIAVLMAAPVEIPITASHVREHRRWFRSALMTVIGVLAAGYVATTLRGPVDNRFFEESYFILAPLLLGYVVVPYLEPEGIDRYARFLALGVALSFIAEVNTSLLRA